MISENYLKFSALIQKLLSRLYNGSKRRIETEDFYELQQLLKQRDLWFIPSDKQFAEVSTILSFLNTELISSSGEDEDTITRRNDFFFYMLDFGYTHFMRNAKMPSRYFLDESFIEEIMLNYYRFEAKAMHLSQVIINKLEQISYKSAYSCFNDDDIQVTLSFLLMETRYIYSASMVIYAIRDFIVRMHDWVLNSNGDLLSPSSISNILHINHIKQVESYQEVKNAIEAFFAGRAFANLNQVDAQIIKKLANEIMYSLPHKNKAQRVII